MEPNLGVFWNTCFSLKVRSLGRLLAGRSVSFPVFFCFFSFVQVHFSLSFFIAVRCNRPSAVYFVTRIISFVLLRVWVFHPVAIPWQVGFILLLSFFSSLPPFFSYDRSFILLSSLHPFFSYDRTISLFSSSSSFFPVSLITILCSFLSPSFHLYRTPERTLNVPLFKFVEEKAVAFAIDKM